MSFRMTPRSRHIPRLWFLTLRILLKTLPISAIGLQNQFSHGRQKSVPKLTATGVHLATLSLDTRSSIPLYEVAGAWGWPLTLFRAEVKNEWTYNSNSLWGFLMGTGTNFIFMGPCIVNQCQQLSNKMRLYTVLLYCCRQLYTFRMIPKSIIRSTVKL